MAGSSIKKIIESAGVDKINEDETSAILMALQNLYHSKHAQAAFVNWLQSTPTSAQSFINLVHGSTEIGQTLGNSQANWADYKQNGQQQHFDNINHQPQAEDEGFGFSSIGSSSI